MIDPSKKTIYHSSLVQAGECTATIKSDPLKSKFQKDGKDSYYSVLVINGNEHQLQLENDSCRSAMTGYKNQTVGLKASGRGDDASIEVEGIAVGSGQPEQQPAPRQQPQSSGQHGALMQQPQQESSKPPVGTSPDQALKEARETIMRITNLHLLCARAVGQYEAPAFKAQTGDELSESQRQGAVASIFIEACRSGLVRSMSPHPLKS